MAKKIVKPAPKPTPKPLPRPKPAQIDLVRNPNFDAAMAQQNYANLMRDQQARIGAESGAPSADPRFDKSKQRGGKEILLSFAGGQYGSVNDEAADAIAKKYNLDIVNKPNPNKDEGPKVYRFSVKGDVDKGLSGIKNEPGVRYAEPNFRSFIPERGPDPFITYEDNRMRAALNGEEIPTPPVGYVEGFDRSKKNPTPPMIGGTDKLPPQGPQAGGGNQDVIDFRKRIYDDLMARRGQFYPPSGGMGGAQNFDIDYIEGGQRNMPMTPTPSQMAQFRNAQQGAVPMDQNTGKIGRQFDQIAEGMMPQNPQGQQQQMQSYQNFLNQGMNNMASVNQGAAANFANTQPGMPTTGSAQQFTANPAMPVAGMGVQKSRPTPRKFSTVSSQPARFV